MVQKFFSLLKNQQLNHHYQNKPYLKLVVYNSLKIYNLVYYLKNSIKLLMKLLLIIEKTNKSDKYIFKNLLILIPLYIGIC